jgi:hypothetical protein
MEFENVVGNIPSEVQRAAANEAGASQGRKQVLARLGSFPKDIQDGLVNGSKALRDVVIVSTSDVTGASVIVFAQDSVIKPGYCTVTGAKLDAQRPAIIRAIKIEFSDAVTAKGEDIADFNPVVFPNELLNGEFELKINEQKVLGPILMSELTTNLAGEAAGDNTRPYGLFVLDNPIFIPGALRIELNITSQLEADAGAIRASLRGSEVY